MIFRDRTQHFTVVSQAIIEDERLSLKDIGLLVWMLSKPDNWKFSMEGILKLLPNDRRCSVQSSINRLKEAGYLEIRNSVRPDGVFCGKEWEVHDKPITERQETRRTENQRQTNTNTYNPTVYEKNYSISPQYSIAPNTESFTTAGNSGNISYMIDKESEREGARAREAFGEYQNVRLSAGELAKIQADFPDDWQARIDRLSEYIASKGDHFVSHFATIRKWAREDSEQRNGTNPCGGYHRPHKPDRSSDSGITIL